MTYQRGPYHSDKCACYINPTQPLIANRSVTRCVKCVSCGNDRLQHMKTDLQQLTYLTILETHPNTIQTITRAQVTPPLSVHESAPNPGTKERRFHSGDLPSNRSGRPMERKSLLVVGWFPDGTQILYSERQLASNKDTLLIATLNPFKRSIIRWRKVPVPSKFKMIYHSAAFSPDGKSILFAGNRIDDYDWDIYRFRLADRKLIQLTQDGAIEAAPQERNLLLSVSPQHLTPTLWGEVKVIK